MALPKIELPGGKFGIKNIIREIEETLGQIFAPLDLGHMPGKEKRRQKGAPGPLEWDDAPTEGCNEVEEGSMQEITASGKKKFPEKKMVPPEKKTMHVPKMRNPELGGRKPGGRGRRTYKLFL
jgi:hypothetical protein